LGAGLDPEDFVDLARDELAHLGQRHRIRRIASVDEEGHDVTLREPASDGLGANRLAAGQHCLHPLLGAQTAGEVLKGPTEVARARNVGVHRTRAAFAE